ncbi:MAG: hypothetical protein A4E53_02460 [Pelotomaculum sp. PtaB.Bin104]|nr:MAG: hypothetical protein A4E53_02460 [Pelotomaculum sp. PtaB.Bin104]
MLGSQHIAKNVDSLHLEATPQASPLPCHNLQWLTTEQVVSGVWVSLSEQLIVYYEEYLLYTNLSTLTNIGTNCFSPDYL